MYGLSACAKEQIQCESVYQPLQTRPGLGRMTIARFIRGAGLKSSLPWFTCQYNSLYLECIKGQSVTRTRYCVQNEP